MNLFFDYLGQLAPEIEAALDRLLPPSSRPPRRVHEAMRYAVLGGGKRIRPALAVLAGETSGAPRERLLEAASTMEMIHTFSLVHDDLPALDDDDLRRGQLTVHRQYDEALAVLVGDALLNLALGILADWPRDLEPERRVRNLRLLAEATGTTGMIGGQVDDLEAEGAAPEDPEATLESIHRRKTGALLVASLRLGANCALAGPDLEEQLAELGDVIGLMFQIRDDILDVEADSEALGKTAGKDERAGKLTYPSVYGLARSREMLEQQRQRGLEVASRLPRNRELFETLLDYLAERAS